MELALAADHGGFQLKEKLRSSLETDGYTLVDFSAPQLDIDDDYPPLAHQVAAYILAHPGSRGILLCRSGQGMAMAANRHPGIRAALVNSVVSAQEARHDNDANVLVLPADFIAQDEAEEIVRQFLQTDFSDQPRHSRRIANIERSN